MSSNNLLTSQKTRLSALLTGIILVLAAGSATAQFSAQGYADSLLIGSLNTPADGGFSYGGDPQLYAGVVNFYATPIVGVGVSSNITNLVGEAVINIAGVLSYYFDVSGPAFTSVPVDFSGVFTSYQESQLTANTFTSLNIQTVGSSVYAYSAFQSRLAGDCGAPSCLEFTTHNNTNFTFEEISKSTIQGTFNGSLDMFTDSTGHVRGMVQLTALATSHAFLSSAAAGAYIDPHLEIDPTFLANNPGASLTITAGVGNDIADLSISAVPEPSTYALMLGGLFLTGYISRRRRHSSQSCIDKRNVRP